MHDLMHNLAIFIAGEEIISSSVSNECVGKTTRHMSFYLDYLPSNVFNAKKAQTLLWDGQCTRNLESQIFPEFEYLRAVALGHYRREVPSSIYKLKHLSHVPLGIGEMTRLEKLYSFVTAKNGPSLEPVVGLGELNGLNNLRGELIIRNLRYVIKDGVSEFRPANLEEKQYLQSLRLEWVIHPFSKPYSGAAFNPIVDNDDYYYKNDEKDLKNENLALDVLRPHPNLQCLFLYAYRGVESPIWLPSLINLVKLE
ncbi:hypothetical protein GH714_001015 [Hevea brasiliensis]|uniref:R13L1/DRL21-like LRR repeat region domain-containing protein n=1 Tax=Hevea brasiliensis TaxID=3981 RepID=A0A6A6KZ12_HEVBR|nr:hypothetical protein GH714_000942 [Hevea brasiliensis]KAF2293365.1 hypothetical protein GH714_001015 [Hevea brasiliensis]